MMREDLRQSFEKKSWTNNARNPRSGPGSNLKSTARLRAAMPGIFERYGVGTFMDAPCGDWFWMREVDLSAVTYLGADISEEVIVQNCVDFASDTVNFRHLDITSDPLPPCDMMMCRECLFHLQFWLRWKFFENFARSDIPYLMTTIDHTETNEDLPRNAQYRRFNPMRAPFNFPEPLEVIPESHDALPDGGVQYASDETRYRSMGIWARSTIVDVVAARPEPGDGGTQ